MTPEQLALPRWRTLANRVNITAWLYMTYIFSLALSLANNIRLYFLHSTVSLQIHPIPYGSTHARPTLLTVITSKHPQPDLTLSLNPTSPFSYPSPRPHPFPHPDLTLSHTPTSPSPTPRT